MSMNTETTGAIRNSRSASANEMGGAIEPWFSVLLSSLVPLASGLFAPDAWRAPLHVLGGVLCAAGLVMLVRHEMAVRRDHNVTHR